MAAGMGSRYGKGLKQLAKVGPNDELNLDYSLYDAYRAGFRKTVFIIREDIREDFRRVLGERWEGKMEVSYVCQELDKIPVNFTLPVGREKPWGTGHAVLCARDAVKEPFLVINADDYYGPETFRIMAEFLHEEKKRTHYGSAGFLLKNTLSESGGVTRGVCRVDGEGFLEEIFETHDIEVKDGALSWRKEDIPHEVSLEDAVSMNVWAYPPEIFPVLENAFEAFLRIHCCPQGNKEEFLLPVLMGELLEKKACRIEVRRSPEKWYGLTYQADLPAVREAVQRMHEEGRYPGNMMEEIG